ncbi:SPFH domain-containing protein [Kitasatospora viridis]|uniref:SPFH domain/Band 7 family protein n=1 Tax=Kitasatospora viridis TaxID=281105 RepID=A0A561TTG2_9ACTN|nr:SPFH domain-containing protein [Kitasatospora viridis]TWF90412.1 SPFH domain/Band 7 family protein [Kitasatospora viridis]
MADITRRFGLSHLRAAPTSHIRHLRGGKLAHDGAGLAFWFHPLKAAISEVPSDDQELSMLFHARTAEFQDLAVQATVTYRITDPATAASRLDFSIAPDTGSWRSDPLDRLGTLLTETAQQHALELIARTPLAQALTDGAAAVRQRVTEALTAEPRLTEIGLSVLAVRVTALRPEPEMERALRTPAREQVQQEADRATYERRAVAVERERAIAENELASRIELARREEQLVTQQGANARQEAEQHAAADAVRAETEAVRRTRLASAEAEATRILAEAQADAERAHGAAAAAAKQAWLDAHQQAGPEVLQALALTRLAENLPRIDSITLTPDALTGLLAKLGRTPAADGPAR